MGITPQAPAFVNAVENVLSTAWAELTGMFRLNPSHQGLTPEQALLNTPNLDPHFIPRAPMSNANLDMGLLAALGNMGFKRGKEITAQSHPEYYAAWTELCRRGGLEHIPQLILVESKIPNAGMIHGEEAGFVTTGLLKRFTFREAIAVQGHEIGHESSSYHTRQRMTANVAFIGAGAIIGNRMAHKGGIGSYIRYDKMSEGWFKKATHVLFGSEKKPLSMLGYLEYIVIGGWLGSILAKQVSVHPTELDADRKGAVISGDPEGLISALGKLEQPHHKRGFWGTIAYCFHFITSGYPSTETRVRKLRHIAQTMPRDVPPVYASVPTLQAPLVASTTAITAQTPAPAAQVSGVAQADRMAPSSAEPIAAL